MLDLVESGPVILQKILKCWVCTFTIFCYLPLDKYAPSFKPVWISITHWCFVPEFAQWSCWWMFSNVSMEYCLGKGTWTFIHRCSVPKNLNPLTQDCFEPKNWTPFTQGCFVSSLIEIGLVVLEKKTKILKVYRQTDGQTDDKLIWAFSSGELKRVKPNTGMLVLDLWWLGPWKLSNNMITTLSPHCFTKIVT